MLRVSSKLFSLVTRTPNISTRRLLNLAVMRFTEEPKKPDVPLSNREKLEAAHNKFTEELMSKTEDAHSFERENIKMPHIVGAGAVALLLGLLLSFFQMRSKNKQEDNTAANHESVLDNRPKAELGG